MKAATQARGEVDRGRREHSDRGGVLRFLLLPRTAWLVLGSVPLACSAAPGPASAVAARAPTATVSSEASSADPIQPADVLALGPGHACVVRSGQVWCWGDNHGDQLGDPAVGAAPRPVRGPTLDGIVGLAAGGTATCALLRTGTVTCWGDSAPGVRPTPDLDDVAEISVASFRDRSRRCARRRNGRVRCWSPAGNEGPAQDLPLRNAVALAGACAVDASGRQRCFEVPALRSGGVRVARARLARPPFDYRVSARQIRAARKDARQLSAMPCVLRTDGTVGCWSNDTNIPVSERIRAATGC